MGDFPSLRSFLIILGMSEDQDNFRKRMEQVNLGAPLDDSPLGTTLDIAVRTTFSSEGLVDLTESGDAPAVLQKVRDALRGVVLERGDFKFGHPKFGGRTFVDPLQGLRCATRVRKSISNVSESLYELAKIGEVRDLLLRFKDPERIIKRVLTGEIENPVDSLEFCYVDADGQPVHELLQRRATDIGVDDDVDSIYTEIYQTAVDDDDFSPTILLAREVSGQSLLKAGSPDSPLSLAMVQFAGDASNELANLCQVALVRAERNMFRSAYLRMPDSELSCVVTFMQWGLGLPGDTSSAMASTLPPPPVFKSPPPFESVQLYFLGAYAAKGQANECHKGCCATQHCKDHAEEIEAIFEDRTLSGMNPGLTTKGKGRYPKKSVDRFQFKAWVTIDAPWIYLLVALRAWMKKQAPWLTMAMIAHHAEMWMWEMPEEKIGPYNSDVLPKAREWWLEKAKGLGFKEIE